MIAAHVNFSLSEPMDAESARSFIESASRGGNISRG
jgi:hypothetical protein